MEQQEPRKQQLPAALHERRSKLIDQIDALDSEARRYTDALKGCHQAIETLQAEVRGIDTAVDIFMSMSMSPPMPLMTQGIEMPLVPQSSGRAASSPDTSSVQDRQRAPRYSAGILKFVSEAAGGARIAQIAAAVGASEEHTEAVLKYHQDGGRIIEDDDGVWHAMTAEAPKPAPEDKPVPPWAAPPQRAEQTEQDPPPVPPGATLAIDLNHGSNYRPGNNAAAAQPSYPMRQDAGDDEIIRIVREAPDGVSDKEFADRGIPFVTVIKAARAGIIHSRDKRYYLGAGG
jgi:hypothetical protein